MRRVAIDGLKFMKRNSTIKSLTDWASDPIKLARFEEVALLTRRTAFIKLLLGLEDSDDFIRSQIARVCERHGVECVFPRGNSQTGVNLRNLNPEQRYMVSVLLKALLATQESGLSSTNEGLVNINLLDRMICVYRRYLSMSRIPVIRAAASFEMFYVVYKAWVMGDVDFVDCENCGSEFVNARITNSLRCPVCQAHRLAILTPGTINTGASGDADSGDVESVAEYG